MASVKKDVMIVKKKKRKDKKQKKKKTTKKKTQERGITVNVNLSRAIGEAKAKAPKTARGFAPKVGSIRGQRARGGGEVNTRQAEINTNLMNNVYAIRAKATKQQEENEKKAKEQGETIKQLSSNIGILQKQLTKLGIQVMNPPKPPAPAPAPAPAPITVNVPSQPATVQPSEDEQKFRADIKMGLVKLGQRQQGLYEGMQLMVDTQHGIHHRLRGIEDAGRQIAGNQGTSLALESNEGNEESNIEPQQPPSPPPSPSAPPMETYEEDPARMSSSVDPQEEEKTKLKSQPQKQTLQDMVTVETVPYEEAKKIGGQKGVPQTRYTADELNLFLGQALQEMGKSAKDVKISRAAFFKNNKDIMDGILKRGGNKTSITNKIRDLRQQEKSRINAEAKMMFEQDKLLIDELEEE